MLIEIFLLAIGSMFWPALLAVDVVAFKSVRPVTILGWFLAGGLLTTVAVGSAVVFSLEQTSFVERSRSTLDPVVSIVVGVAALVAAFLVRRRGQQKRATPPKPHKPSRVDRLGSSGGWVAFVTGVVLNVFPGVLPFIALKDIDELNYSTAATFAVILGFYLVMFVPVEAPLVAFLVVPRPTERAVGSFNVWLGQNARTLACWALAIFGVAEIVRGIIAA